MKFKSPLAVSNLFWTPESMEELQDTTLANYTGQARVAALTTMAFAINMCAKAVDDEAAKQATENLTLTALQDIFSDAMQFDLENGSQWLNEHAAIQFSEHYPLINKAIGTLCDIDVADTDDDYNESLIEDYKDMERDIQSRGSMSCL